MGAFTQNFIVQDPGKKKHKTGALDVPVRLWNPDGTPFTAAAGGKAAEASVTPPAEAITDLPADADTARIAETVNLLLAAARAHGVIAEA